MLRELLMQNSTDYIAFVSAIVGVISAILAYSSYKLTKKEGSDNRYNTIIEKCRKNLDKSYLVTSEFINNFSDQDESKDKRISRDQIMYLLELLRKEFPEDKRNTSFNSSYEKLIICISDITYESNVEKVFRDLSTIKDLILSLKNSLLLK
jgi:hypothetical protein